MRQVETAPSHRIVQTGNDSSPGSQLSISNSFMKLIVTIVLSNFTLAIVSAQIFPPPMPAFTRSWRST